jgi:ABC-type dipeptide/oligopeptide/nickel transport system permease component
MIRSDYLLKRVTFAIVTIFVVITLNFFMFRVLPGTAVTNLSKVPNASAQLRRELRIEFGLNLPVGTQYLDYLKELAHGNLGISFGNQQPVASNLKTALLNTLPVVTIATVISLIIGIGTGVLSAWRRGSKLDHLSTNAAIVLYALPTQWIALILLIAPVSFWSNLGDLSSHMTLPALTLVLTLYGGNTLIIRSALLETLGEDYMLTARAKGIGKRRMMWSHALRNAMLPITTLIALSFGTIVAGAILMEVVFSWPGIGQALYQSVQQRDYPMMQGGFLLITVSVVLFNLLADLVYFKLDPRIKA